MKNIKGNGPGKYNDICTLVRKKTNASGAMVIITDGNQGSGFSCQLPDFLLIFTPKILRDIADQIEGNK